jgi:hypothetical protein
MTTRNIKDARENFDELLDEAEKNIGKVRSYRFMKDIRRS